MQIHVSSEIGQLREVVVHRPGAELEQLTPPHLSRMLFDDIPFLLGAQREHDMFADVLTREGAQVRYLKDLAAQSIGAPEVRERFVQEVIDLAGDLARYERQALTELLLSMPTDEALVEKTMSGVRLDELPKQRRQPLSNLVRHDTRYLMDPIPNLYFTRDPFSVVGRGVVFSRMYAATRQRETIYGRYIFAHHPDYAGRTKSWYKPELPFSLEGGDILNLGNGVLGVG